MSPHQTSIISLPQQIRASFFMPPPFAYIMQRLITYIVPAALDVLLAAAGLVLAAPLHTPAAVVHNPFAVARPAGT